MAKIIAWALFALGAAHVAFGIVRYRAPLLDAMAAGFIDQFKDSDLRRTAFWFIAFGPLLMLTGLTAVQAVGRGDLAQLRQIGFFMAGMCAVGVLAFPLSPLLVGLVMGVLVLAVGYGWIT